MNRLYATIGTALAGASMLAGAAQADGIEKQVDGFNVVFNGVTKVRQNMQNDCKTEGGNNTCCYYSTTYNNTKGMRLGKIELIISGASTFQKVDAFKGNFEFPSSSYSGKEQWAFIFGMPSGKITNNFYDNNNKLIGSYSFDCPPTGK